MDVKKTGPWLNDYVHCWDGDSEIIGTLEIVAETNGVRTYKVKGDDRMWPNCEVL